MKSTAKWALALGLGAVVGAFVSGVRFRHFRDYVAVRLDELLVKAQGLNRSPEDGVEYPE